MTRMKLEYHIDKNKDNKFRRPSLEEVTAYCDERRNGIDPQAFLDFYDSKGWKVGNTPMKDWRAAIRTWESKRKTPPPTPSPKKEESLSDYYRKLMSELNIKPNAIFFDTPDEQ